MNTNDLEKIPPDSGGQNLPYPLGSTACPYGFYLYTPGGYTPDNAVYPFLLFLHGSAERGDSKINGDELKKMLYHGPNKLINIGWRPPAPMLIASLQCHEVRYDAYKIQKAIQFFIKNYAINEKRIYLTGLSMGAIAIYDYLGAFDKKSLVAAAVPIAGRGHSALASQMTHVPIWAFHGDHDHAVPVNGSIDMITSINNSDPDIKARLTIYPGVDHDSWTMTYDDTGRGRENPHYDTFDRDIYSWMLQYTRKT